MTFSQIVKNELYKKVEIITIKQKRDMVESAMANGEFINMPCESSKEIERAMLKGAFLGAGQITNPSKSYHIEFRCKTLEHARFVLMLLDKFDIKGNLATNNNIYRIYIKKSEDIIDLLNIIGAHNAIFKMYDAKILKQVTNDANRKYNCDIANINRTTSAALKQINDINIIKDKVGLESLGETLEQTANIRLDNPDCSLEELSTMLKPKVTKSALNHRFRKIHNIAMEYIDE